MLIPTNVSEKPLMVTQVDEWIYVTVGKYAALYHLLLAAEDMADRQLAFLEMSRLLHEAIEEIRVLGTTLRENSTLLRERTTELLEHSQRLLTQSAPHQDRSRSDGEV